MEPTYIYISIKNRDDGILAICAWIEGSDLVYVPHDNLDAVNRIALALVRAFAAC